MRKQLEIDFVCTKGSNKIYIQSSYVLDTEEKKKQETRPFKNIKDSFKKIVITSNTSKPHYDDNGIYIMNIYDFLLNPNSLEF